MNEISSPSSPVHPPSACHYCGLPVAGDAVDGRNLYCCLGCRFAASITSATGDQGEARLTAMALALSVFFTMNVVMLTMALWSYAATPQTPFELALAAFLRHGALLFTAPVLLILGRPLAIQTWDQLRRGLLSTDLLLLTGVLAAYAVSVVSTIRGTGHVYYEVACVILVLVTLGRWLEANGRLKATSALDQLEQLLPEVVDRLSLDGHWKRIPRETVTIGDCLRILPGERIPVDGKLIRGRSVVDEQFFTGESTPIEKRSGDAVLGGSLNLDGDIQIEASAPPTEGALGRLVQAVREARLRKGHFQLLADRWSQRFFPVIVVVAGMAFAFHTYRSGWETGSLTALSVILIACPCALALATPLAIWTSLATAARHGVLFRSGEALERLATVRAIRWDKTGTLTTGMPHVSALLVEVPQLHDDVKSAALTLVAGSKHIYSAAIQRYLDDTQNRENVPIQTIPGRGLQMTHPTVGRVVLGSIAWMADCGMAFGPRLAERFQATSLAEAACVFLGWQGQIQGIFVLEEALRPEATTALYQCGVLHLDLAVLTGDREIRARHWQARLNIPVRGELLPEQKLAAIQQAHDQFDCVAMVGDGLNDAPALAAADIGIALGCGADVTRDSADVCVLPNTLTLIPWAIEWSRRTVHTVRGNLFWSFGYNSLGVIVAACGWLHPAIAAVLMVVSSLMVLGNSLRLQHDLNPEENASDLDTPAVTVASIARSLS